MRKNKESVIRLIANGVLRNYFFKALVCGLMAYSYLETPAFAAPRIDIRASVEKVSDSPSDLIIAGDVTVSNWQAKEKCFLLRFNDEEYGWDHGEQRRLDSITGSGSQTRYSGGETTLFGKKNSSSFFIQPHILKIQDPKADNIQLSFRSTVPKTAGGSPSDTFFDGFYPHPLVRCPIDGESVAPVLTDIKAEINLPTEFQFAAQNSKATKEGFVTSIQARSLAFGISQSYKRRSFQVGGIKVELYFYTNALPNLESTIRSSIPLAEKWLGAFPHETLTIVETSELQRQSLGGIIPLNSPRQSVFSKAQSAKGGLLNWSHWMMVKLLTTQWFGSKVFPESLDDLWLVEGTRDFVVSDILQQQPAIFNLLSNPKHVSVTYLQLQEYSAAQFHKKNPFSTLTDENLVSKDNYLSQSPLLRVKQIFTMRQLSQVLGRDTIQSQFKSMVERHKSQPITPRSFYDSLNSKTQSAIKGWWINEGWPDFSFEDLESNQSKSGQYTSEVLVDQVGGVNFPPEVAATDSSGKVHFSRAKKDPQSEYWKAEFSTSHKVIEAEADPNHESFDINRFNNSSEWTSINFFPGSAKNIADDAYTVLWLPFIQRKPGEPWAILIHGAIMSYINSGLFFELEFAPDTSQTKGKIRYRYEFPDYGIHGDIQIQKSFEDDQIAEITAVRSPLFQMNPRISINLGVRRKERIGIKDSDHITGAFAFSVKPETSLGSCNFNISGEIENAPEAFAHDFSYERKMVSSKISCGRQRFGFFARGFWGKLDFQGPTPETAFFKPTESGEASLSVTQGELSWPAEITTASTQIKFPMYLPLPSDSMVLINRLRGDIFYDWGHAKENKIDYRSGGLGLQLPFGGDLTGAGSLSFTTIRAFAVLYSRVGTEESREPKFFVVVQGDL